MNKKLSLQELNRLSIDDYHSSSKTPITVVLDNIRSMHNVGSVFRSGDAFRVEKIFLCGFTPQPPHRDIRKTAIGATETVAWEHKNDTLETVHSLKNEGYQIVVVEQTAKSTLLKNLRLNANSKIALVVGNEVGGVDQSVVDIADVCLEIEQFGTKHSLNVSVCTGICLWEIAKQMYFSI